MNPDKSLNRTLLIYAALICASLTGCAPLKQYRTVEQPFHYDNYRNAATRPATGITNIIEVATNYTLGFVEFDDQGWLYNKTNEQTQIQTVIDRFKDELKTNGLLMVVFVHGWQHDARDGDSNVVMFHKVIQKLDEIEAYDSKTNHRPARRLAGVYVGWRGRSVNIEGVNNLTFWDRKSTAEQVGHGEVIELLAQLERLRNQSNQRHAGEIKSNMVASTRFVTIGHSFGADVVYCATAPILAERMIENYDGTGQLQPPKTLGDLVILINPAFEAARFETLHRLGMTEPFPKKTCTLAVFTSTKDEDTKFYFPLGRWFSTQFEKYQSGTDEGAANRTAIGHYQPFINYDLRTIYHSQTNRVVKNHVMTNVVMETEGTPGTNTTAESVKTINSLKQQLREIGPAQQQISNDQHTNVMVPDAVALVQVKTNGTFPFSQCKVVPRSILDPTLNPIFNIAVTAKLIPDHNTIDKPAFIQFLAEFITLFSSN